MKKNGSVRRRADASLVKRYLFWLYKTTRDELDRIDRKFTQLEIDRDLQRIFQKREGEALDPFIEEWERYIANKEAEARKCKFDNRGGVLDSYAFLCLKREAIERVTTQRFGRSLLREFEKMIEVAAMKNILQDTLGKR